MKTLSDHFQYKDGSLVRTPKLKQMDRDLEEAKARVHEATQKTASTIAESIVLVCESDKQMRNQITHELQSHGYIVFGAENGLEKNIKLVLEWPLKAVIASASFIGIEMIKKINGNVPVFLAGSEEDLEKIDFPNARKVHCPMEAAMALVKGEV